ncbi:DUF6452 family protein [Bacteroides reticulotermitis]|uniref:DUF6452 family protein n=1 Tax=Bacteroides reticulotermitis TaxID=1133319 RepID=UPI003A876B09
MKNLITKRFMYTLATTYIVLSVASCVEEENCSQYGRESLTCNVYTLEDSKAVKDTLDSLHVTALGTDSIILNREAKVRSFSLPLRYTNDTTTFVLKYINNIKDTIRVIHTNTPKFISMDCGYQVSQVVEKVSYTKHQLDSIYISDEEANTTGTENLQLFY